MSSIFFSLIVLIPSLIGWGRLLKRWLFPNFATAHHSMGDDGIFGFIALGFIGTLLNFFIPLYSGLCLFFVLLGIFFFFRWTHFFLLRKSWWISLGLLLTACTFYAFRSPHAYDTGLYHLPMTIWHHLSQLPIGLAHVHNRFAGNHIWFNIAAMFWLPHLELAAVFSAPTLLLLFFLLSFVEYLFWNTPSTTAYSWSKLYALSILIFFVLITQVGYSVMGALRGLATDVPTALIALYSLFYGIRLLEFSPVNDANEKKYLFDRLLILCAFSITIKISAAPVVLLLVPFLRLLTVNRTFNFLVPFSAAWLIKGFLISGCFAWPVAFTCLESPSWGVGPQNARWHTELIQAWGRGIPVYNGTPPKFAQWDWISPWIPYTFGMPFIRFVLSLWIFCTGILLLFSLRSVLLSSKINFLKHKGWVWIGLVQLVGILFWFLSAPEFRQGYSFLMGLTILLLTLALLCISKFVPFDKKLPHIAMLLCVIYFLNGVRMIRTEFLESVPMPWPNTPAIKIGENYSQNGYKFSFPESGDQCWNASIPCTPKKNENLIVKNQFGFLIFTQHKKDFRGVL